MMLQNHALPVHQLPISLLPSRLPAVRLLSDANETEQVPAGETVFQSEEKSDCRLLVVRGLVELRLVRNDGATPLLRLCPPGRVVLPVPLQDVIAVARVPSELQPLRESDEHSHAQCALFASDVAQMTEVHTESAGLAKLAKLLLLYASAFGQTRGKLTMVLPLTTIDLASALGIELRTVSRCLGTLRGRGLVRREGQGLLSLQNTEGLASLCHL